jgi:hypothetical protein
MIIRHRGVHQLVKQRALAQADVGPGPEIDVEGDRPQDVLGRCYFAEACGPIRVVTYAPGSGLPAPSNAYCLPSAFGSGEPAFFDLWVQRSPVRKDHKVA